MACCQRQRIECIRVSHVRSLVCAALCCDVFGAGDCKVGKTQLVNVTHKGKQYNKNYVMVRQTERGEHRAKLERVRVIESRVGVGSSLAPVPHPLPVIVLLACRRAASTCR